MQRRCIIAQMPCVWHRKPEAWGKPTPPLFGQFHPQGAHALSDESLQQLTGSISIRNPSPLRTALGDELEKQPAICFLRWNNNGAKESCWRKSKQIPQTQPGAGKTTVQPLEVPANSTLRLSTIITTLPPTLLSPDNQLVRKHYLIRELDSKPR